MITPDAQLQIIPVTDPATRDNFQKLQRLLQGTLVRFTGEVSVLVSNVASPDPTWTITYERIGYHVMWQGTADLISTAKPNTSNPIFRGALPKILWPKSTQRIPYRYYHNGTDLQNGTVVIDTSGNVTFYPASAWTNAAALTLYGTAVHYLGS